MTTTGQQLRPQRLRIICGERQCVSLLKFVSIPALAAGHTQRMTENTTTAMAVTITVTAIILLTTTMERAMLPIPPRSRPLLPSSHNSECAQCTRIEAQLAV